MRQAPDEPADRSGRQASDLGDVLLEGSSVDTQRDQLFGQYVGRNAVEEQVHGDDHNHEVVEAAQDGNIVGDEVPAEEQVT